MRVFYVIAVITIFLCSCSDKTRDDDAMKQPLPIVGTWKLLTGTTIQGKDTVVTDYTKGQSFIKIINDTHFAFFNHDLNMGKDSSKAIFVSGGGRYTLDGNKYTEHLEYCNYREWENNDFEFTVTITGDTLVIRGIEKVDKLNVNRINIEKYVRLKE